MKNSLIIRTISIILLFLIVVSSTFAYFTANIIGMEKATTITAGTGVLSIVYDGGADIVMYDILPSHKPALVKTFILNGTNTTSLEVDYLVKLIIVENTFTKSALKYSLISTNNDNNGEVVPNQTLNNIESNNIILGNGKFLYTGEESKKHSYQLELYFPDINENQNINQGKIFKAYIEVST